MNLTQASASLRSCRPRGCRPITDHRIILSFDIEEHHRIESAAGVVVPHHAQARYLEDAERSTDWLLGLLGEFGIRATFFILGELGYRRPGLVKRIAGAGHEVASHGWGHERLHQLTPAQFQAETAQSKKVLEDCAGVPVVGYRAPTFSLTRQTAWAVDVLAELGFKYDSSIYPVRHDRYGVPDAPRQPFRLQGSRASVLELPPATLRIGPLHLPVGGGGYFRLLPDFLLQQALAQTQRYARPAVSMLYFHPWEFEPRQDRLPLRGLNRWRTYVGLHRSRARLRKLLRGRLFSRAVNVAEELRDAELECFRLTPAEAKGALPQLADGKERAAEIGKVPPVRRDCRLI